MRVRVVRVRVRVRVVRVRVRVRVIRVGESVRGGKVRVLRVPVRG